MVLVRLGVRQSVIVLSLKSWDTKYSLGEGGGGTMVSPQPGLSWRQVQPLAAVGRSNSTTDTFLCVRVCVPLSLLNLLRGVCVYD